MESGIEKLDEGGIHLLTRHVYHWVLIVRKVNYTYYEVTDATRYYSSKCHTNSLLIPFIKFTSFFCN